MDENTKVVFLAFISLAGSLGGSYVTYLLFKARINAKDPEDKK